MTTATATNTATVNGIYAAFGRGDIPHILGQLAEDVAWDADWADNRAQRAGVAHLAPRRGRAGAVEFFTIIGSWQVDDFRVLDVIGSGRQVVAEVAAGFTLPGGAKLVDEELHLWSFDSTGKVVRFRHYVDTAKHVAAAAGAAAPGGSNADG